MSWCPTHKISSEVRPQLFGALCEWWHWPYHTLTISFHMRVFLKPLPGKKWRCTVWHQRPWHSTKTKIFTIFDPLMQLTTLRALSYTTDPWIPYFSSIHENAGMLWSASFAPFRKVASIKYFFCDIVYGTPAAAESAAVAVGLKLWVCMSSWPNFHTFPPPPHYRPGADY